MSTASLRESGALGWLASLGGRAVHEEDARSSRPRCHAQRARAERLPADTFAQLGPDHVRIAKTASRSTLGYMKEMAFELEWNIANDGGLDRIDIDELNHALRRQLRSHGRDYARPIELVNEHLANQHRPANA